MFMRKLSLRSFPGWKCMSFWTRSTQTSCTTRIQTSLHDSPETQHIENVVVVGGGSMGSGIALLAARNNFHVTVLDKEDEYLQKCMVMIRRSLGLVVDEKFPNEHRSAQKFVDDTLSNIQTTVYADVAFKDADLVIEAIHEDILAKKALFKRIDKVAPPKTIFTSNTSSLSIAELASCTERPDRFAGLHFNPILMMQLTEVIKSPWTTTAAFSKIYKFSKDLGKTPVVCQDTPGFIVNRLLIPYILEAIRLVERGVASVKDIDSAIKLGAGYKLGPFELADQLGVDLVKSIADELHRQNPEDPHFSPTSTLPTMISKGMLGWKSEEGFYNYKAKSIG